MAEHENNNKKETREIKRENMTNNRKAAIQLLFYCLATRMLISGNIGNEELIDLLVHVILVDEFLMYLLASCINIE